MANTPSDWSVLLDEFFCIFDGPLAPMVTAFKEAIKKRRRSFRSEFVQIISSMGSLGLNLHFYFLRKAVAPNKASISSLSSSRASSASHERAGMGH